MKTFDLKKWLIQTKLLAVMKSWQTHNGGCQDFQWRSVINVWSSNLKSLQLHQIKTNIKVWNDVRISKWVFRLEWTVSLNVFVSKSSSLFGPVWFDWIKSLWLHVWIQMYVLKRKKNCHMAICLGSSCFLMLKLAWNGLAVVPICIFTCVCAQVVSMQSGSVAWRYQSLLLLLISPHPA